ncbi:hypothetical protein [Agaribacterium haliotis]|uniref:hypothetical protein n=1 Tax=Agaribacterium haliotis TaxID=2013869 RepID=UPI0011784F4F|nr:hypothetical protein [Agaribacterium haliotis]
MELRRLTPEEARMYRNVPAHAQDILRSVETLGVDLHKPEQCTICSNKQLGLHVQMRIKHIRAERG